MNNKNLFCDTLPTKPRPEIGKVLVSGATGYVGGHLIKELHARGYKIRALTRKSDDKSLKHWPDIEVVVADALDIDQISEALKGIHTAYYLIHSLLLGPDQFENAEIEAANNFLKAAEINNVKRIIYLGALGDSRTILSAHLRTRLQVAEKLQSGKVKTTILRAGIILGPGSASFEIIKNLSEKIPVFLLPKWAKTKCQPISIRSLIHILVGVLETDETIGKTYDIGGKEILSYEKMLRIFSKVLNKKKLFIRSFFGNVKLYTYFISYFTPIPPPLIRLLIESCQYEVICMNKNTFINTLYQPLEFEEAIVQALQFRDRNIVNSEPLHTHQLNKD